MTKVLPYYDVRGEAARRGLTNREISRATGIPESRVSEILNGRRNDAVRLSKISGWVMKQKLPTGATA